MSNVTSQSELTTKEIVEQAISDYHESILPYLNGMVPTIANKFDKANLYSTDEQIVGRWIDGKPLYQKYITYNVVNCLPSQYTIITSVASLNIDSLISARFRKCDADGNLINGWFYPFNYSVENNNLKVYMTGANDRTNGCIIQYTKTTDEAIAIGSDTDYSLEEKIIGTWIDGKPLYQKTFVDALTLDSTSKQMTVAHNISNIGTIVKVEATAIRPTDNASWPIPQGYEDAYYYFAGCDKINLSISRKDATGWSGFKITFTIQYTKTTD